MSADRLVVDASVLAALAFNEPRADDALQLLSDHRLVAPTLLRYELASVAHRKCCRHPDARGQILAALQTALELDIEYIEPAPVAIVELASESGLTTYDASYLHASLLLRCSLATFDATLSRAWQTTRVE